MTYWPPGLAVDPIGEWPGDLTTNRRASPFEASLTNTMDTLRRELTALGARDARLQVAIPADAFRLDGYPRASAKPEHPGVILTLESKHGPLSYPCDTFTTWQANLRAIALALEALRKVDRYGVTRGGEQYRGFRALEATPSTEFPSADAARDYIAGLIHDAEWTTVPGDVAMQVRQAKRLTHPDTGGRPEDFHRVIAAEKVLRADGRIA
jgi:hypothetical protein